MKLSHAVWGHPSQQKSPKYRRYFEDRVPDELWNEVRDIVQETGIKTIPMEKTCKKAKWLSEEASQRAVKRREAKSKEEKERYNPECRVPKNSKER